MPHMFGILQTDMTSQFFCLIILSICKEFIIKVILPLTPLDESCYNINSFSYGKKKSRLSLVS
jgi:hypothetical protein